MPALRASSLRHVRPVEPLHFPVTEPDEERMPESKRHRLVCEALVQMLRHVTAGAHALGFDQFLYYDAADPKRCVAPDAFVRLGVEDFMFRNYKVWEHGAPELAVEVLSPSDSPERLTWREKLAHYRHTGIREIVACHLDAKPGKRLRIWDRLDGDLVERVTERDRSPCLSLGLFFLVAPVNGELLGLRLARDLDGRDPILTTDEALAAERSALAAERSALAAEREKRAAAENEARKLAARLKSTKRRSSKRRRR